MEETFNWIGGVAVTSASTFQNISPENGGVLSRAHEADHQIVDEAVRTANEAYLKCLHLSASDRAQMLEDIADAIEGMAEEFARAEAEDIGRPLAQVRSGHVARTVDIFRLYADLLKTKDDSVRHATATSPNTDAGVCSSSLSYTIRRPRGVIGVIAPWNVPLLLLALNVAPALAAGNAVVAKPSEESPRSASLLAKAAQVAEVPAGLFNVVHGFGAGSAGEALTRHPGVSAFGFTGEGGSATRIMQAAANGLRDVLFELGGKNPGLIFADADIEAAIDNAALAAFANSGQVCLSIERLYVERSVLPQVVAGLKKAAASYVLGGVNTPGANLGPLISRRHRDKVLTQINAAVEEGACLEYGGEVPDFGDARDNGAFLTPAVLTGLDNDSAFLKDEVFGPVIHVSPFDDDDEAITLANDTDFGLASMTWTRDLVRANRCAREIRAGINWINCWQVRDLSTPLQGFGKSGIGVQGGQESLDFYSCVTTATMMV